jgi:hypothetical protein
MCHQQCHFDCSSFFLAVSSSEMRSVPSPLLIGHAGFQRRHSFRPSALQPECSLGNDSLVRKGNTVSEERGEGDEVE